MDTSTQNIFMPPDIFQYGYGYHIEKTNSAARMATTQLIEK
jgi:hypothetical protein